MVGRVFSVGGTQLAINADTADYNVFTAAGSPAAAVDVVVTIASGVVVYQNAGVAALRTGTFPAGSKIKILNRGIICGKGGSGGTGGSGGAAGANGNGGGTALQHDSATLEIDNTSGYILGGGGGGGGGEGVTIYGGGGGGGGRGRISVGGGAGGSAVYPGNPGDSGSYSGAGAGGSGGGGAAQGGGWGGDWGSMGESGGEFNQPVNSGGLPGYAVRIAGGSVTWSGGYNIAQVQGTVG